MYYRCYERTLPPLEALPNMPISLKLKIFITIAVLLVAPFWTGETKAIEPAPEPLWAQNLHEPVELIKTQYTEAVGLELANFSYAPMGTYQNSFSDQSQCTAGVASSKGNITWRGDAKDWANQARARGITVSAAPVVGSVAQTSAGAYGHVAVVVSVGASTVTVLEKNFDWNGGIRTFTHPTSKFVYIYL